MSLTVTKIVLVFYVGYIVCELPSNIVLKKIGPKIWLAFLTFAWGLACLGIGFARNWQTVAVCRVLLGIFEAVRLALSLDADQETFITKRP